MPGQPDCLVCGLQTFAAMCLCVGGGGAARKLTLNMNTAPCTIVLCRPAILPAFLCCPESVQYSKSLHGALQHSFTWHCNSLNCTAQLYMSLRQSALYSTSNFLYRALQQYSTIHCTKEVYTKWYFQS